MPLRCELHTASIYDRGGTRFVGALGRPSRIQWERTKDSTSFATVDIAEPSETCLPVLQKVEPNRHELVIFRGQERVWEGPITLISREGDSFSIDARDVSHYVYRTIAHNGYDNGNVGPVVDRAVDMITAELNRTKEQLDPPINVVPHLRTVRHDDVELERRTTRVTGPFQLSVFDDLSEMSRTGGLDWTVVGRSIVLNDTRVPVGVTPLVTENDFIGPVIVASYGMDSATRAVTTGDAGMYGIAGGVDDFYGEWEILDSMFDEDTLEAPTQNSLDNAARYNLYGKLPVPTVVRIPQNSRLNPNGVLSMKHLVPGVRVPLSATLTLKELTQLQKLNSMSVTETADGEEINVSMVTAPAGIGEGSGS